MMKKLCCPKCGSYNVHRVPGGGIICNDCRHIGEPKEELPKLG